MLAIRYYDRVFVEESLSLDDALVKEYFPVDVVVPTILEIYQDLLGVEFQEVKGNLWHPGEPLSIADRKSL
jgi:Zn-dependent oligopeptidase